MKSLSGLGLGLSLVFGCLLFALVAELYYLLWWKKKRISSKRENGEEIEDGKTTGLFHHNSSWRNPSLSSPSPSPSTLRSETQVHEQTTVHFHGENGDSNKEFWYKPFGENVDEEEEEEEDDDDDDDELMRLQNMGGGGLPRFLFTIKEETKEEMMESEEDEKSSRDRNSSRRRRKGSRSRSLSDLFHVMEITTNTTPYLTPIASPPYFTPPLTPIRIATETEAEFNWLSSCSSFSPPPNFQFLKDAEKKHHGRKLSDELEIVDRKGVFREEEINGSFITLLVARRNREEEQNSPNTNNTTTSQVLPLSSSPPSPSPPTAGKPKLTTSSSKSHHIPFSSFSRNSIK